jgi:hypothetical protein
MIDEQASRQRQHWQRFEHEHPNSLWQMDFKGDYPTLELRFTHKSTQHFGSGARGACKQRQTMLTSRNFIACDV